jgi:hypothetical protein
MPPLTRYWTNPVIIKNAFLGKHFPPQKIYLKMEAFIYFVHFKSNYGRKYYAGMTPK